MNFKIYYLLIRRGISAQPVLNGYCGDYEYGMDRSVFLLPEFNYFPKMSAKLGYTSPLNSQNRLTSSSFILLKLSIAIKFLF